MYSYIRNSLKGKERANDGKNRYRGESRKFNIYENINNSRVFRISINSAGLFFPSHNGWTSLAITC